MTTLTDRPNTALLVIDVQNGVVGGSPNRDEVVANVTRLVDRAREQDVPVVWVQHSDEGLVEGSDEWQYVPELHRNADEPLIAKNWGDSFEDTDLAEVLADRQVGRLVVCGAQTDACIRSTLHGAVVRGFDAVLVADAHTTEDLSEWGGPTPEAIIGFTNFYWQGHRAPGRRGGLTTTETVDFTGTGQPSDT